MTFTVPGLDAINDAARKNAFSIDEINWQMGVDTSRFWGPESFTHLYYCPSYQLLTDEEKRFYNQVHACGIAEQFVFLEEILLVDGLVSLMRRMGSQLAPNMREAMEVFVAEERKHSAMFDRLLKLAAPELYSQKRFVVHLLSKPEKLAMDLSLSQPQLFIWWVWMAIIFEEKTLDFYRKYKSAPDTERVDPLFHAVHKFHAKDEMRHFQLDHHFLELLWDPAPSWKRWFNAHLFSKVVRSFTHPKRTVRYAIERLVAQFPRLEAHRATLLADIMSVSQQTAWQKAFYSRDALPYTFALFDRYPEMHGLTGSIPLYAPQVA